MDNSQEAIDSEIQDDPPTIDEADTPGVPEGFQQLDPRSVSFNRLGSFIFTGIVATVFSVASLIVTLSMGGISWVPMLVTGIGACITAFFLWLSIIWPRREYNNASWRLDEFGLQIRRGVFWRHQISIPIARVQHADVSQGPLQRQFGLAKLTVHTAGTQNASVPIEGLAHETAIEMRDTLVAQRESGHVV